MMGITRKLPCKSIIPIPLKREEVSTLEPGTYLKFKLDSRPNAQQDDHTFMFEVPIFKGGTTEQWLKFNKDLAKVFAGQLVQAAADKYTMTRRLLDGDALATFNELARTAGDENAANYLAVMRGLAEHVMPRNALQLQKRYMRRFMHKPADMKVRDFIARVQEINAHLANFPPFG